MQLSLLYYDFKCENALHDNIFHVSLKAQLNSKLNFMFKLQILKENLFERHTF